MAHPTHYRQGDVLLVEVDHQLVLPIDAPASEADGRRGGLLVLAQGEATGHAHVVADPLAQVLRADGRRLVVLPQDALVVHEEHAALRLPAATYEVRIQREYEPGEVGSVDVAD